jgi:hypothetical protein
MKKNIWKLFGIIALVAVIGLGLAGCPTEDDDGGGGIPGIPWPAEYQNTTWTRTGQGDEAVKVEFRTSDLTVTKFDNSTEVWPAIEE